MQKNQRFPRLLILISLGFLLIFTSCSTQKSKVETTKALFFTNQIELPKSSLLIDFVLPYDSILPLMNIKKGKAIVEISESSSSDPLSIILLNKPNIIKRKDEIQLSNCQLSFKARPSLAGINAGWIEGNIKVDLSLMISNQSTKQVHFKETNYTYQWLTTPKVKVMGFPVNVSSLLDKYIQSKEGRLKEAILTKINSMVEVNQWLPKVKQMVLNQSFGEYQLLSKEMTLDVISFNFEDQQVVFRSKIEGPLGLSFKDSPSLNYQLKGSEPNLVSYYADQTSLQSMFDLMISNKIPHSFKKINLNSISNKGIGLEVLGMFGKHSRITFDCDLGIKNSKIYFYPDNTQINHLGFPYNFFKGSIKSKLARTIGKMTIDIPQMLSKDTTNKMFKDIQFKEIRTNPSGVLLLGKINNAVLKIYP